MRSHFVLTKPRVLSMCTYSEKEMRLMAASSISLLLLLVLPLRAGIYTSIDTIEETQQYGLTLNRFRDVLKEWKLVGLSDEKFDDYRNQLKWDTEPDPPASAARNR